MPARTLLPGRRGRRRFPGDAGGKVRALEEAEAADRASAADGKDLKKIPLESVPAIDGRLIMTTADGQVVCFGAK